MKNLVHTDERILRKKLSLVEASLSAFNTLDEQKIFNLILFLATETLKYSLSNEIEVKKAYLSSYLKIGNRTASKVELQKVLDELISTNVKINKVEVFNKLHPELKSERERILREREQEKERLKKRARAKRKAEEEKDQKILEQIKAEEKAEQKEKEEEMKKTESNQRSTFFTNIDDDEDKVVFTVNPKIKKYLEIKNSKGHKNIDPEELYISTFMSVTRNSKNFYTSKIIELLTHNVFFNKGRMNNNFTIEINSLKELLGCEDKYSKNNMFMKKVINTAKKEAKEKFQFDFNAELVKRAVGDYDVVFSMTDEAKQAYKAKLDSIEYANYYGEDKSTKEVKKGVGVYDIVKDEKVIKTVIKKSEDVTLSYVKKRAQDKTIEIVKEQLMSQIEAPAYKPYFRKKYKDIRVNNDFNKYDVIRKNGTILTIYFKDLQYFVNCMNEQINYEEEMKKEVFERRGYVKKDKTEEECIDIDTSIVKNKNLDDQIV